MRIYTETQEELTSELSDFKEKYREVVDLLRDTQNELKTAKKRSYPGMGEHKVSGMFDTNTTKESKTHGKKRHYFCYAFILIFVYTSMTSLLAHTVAQPTKWRFLPKNLSQLVIFVIELAFT